MDKKEIAEKEIQEYIEDIRKGKRATLDEFTRILYKNGFTKDADRMRKSGEGRGV
jgi:hypothetical protein